MSKILDMIRELPRNLGSPDRMSPKSFFRLAIILIILLLIFNWIFPYLVYGYNMISNSDELRFFNRGKAIAIGEVDIYHYWNDPNYIDAYPPAVSLIITAMLTMNPGIDAFTVQFIYKAFILVLTLLLYFWLGTFFSRKTALAAIFFRSCIFMILTDFPSLYTYMLPYGIMLGGGNYTEIAVLLTIILIFRFLKHTGSDRTNLALIFLVGLTHGESHISGFMSFSIFFSLFMALYAALLSAREIRTLLPKMKPLSYLLKLTKATFDNRVMLPVYVTFLLPLLLHLTFYYKIVEEASPAIYYIENILPLSMPPTTYFILIIALFVFGAFALIKGGRGATYANGPTHPSISPRTWQIALLLYLACFVAIIYVVNRTPEKYNYLSFAIMTGFPSYLPLNNMGLVPLLSIIAGFILFVVSLLGLIEMRNDKNPASAFLVMFYLISYYFFTFTFMLNIMRPHRSMFFLIILPMLLSAAVVNMRGVLRIISGYAGRLRFDSIPIPAGRFLRSHSRQISAIIIVGFFAIGLFGRANLDPIVRDMGEVIPLLQFGNVGAPLATTSFIEKVKEFYTPGEAILSSPDTQTTLFPFLDFVIMSPYWNENIYDNSNFSEVFYSLHYSSGHSPSKWLVEHGGSLVVLGYLDVLSGPPAYGYYDFNLQQFDNDNKLVKIFQNEFGERIYRLNVTA